MQTGENEQGLRKILDMTRMISIILMLLHFYYYCYGAFKEWKATAVITDRILSNIVNTGLFGNFHRSKFIALAFLIISLVGARGRKDQKITYRAVINYGWAGLTLFFGSWFLFYLGGDITVIAALYMLITSAG